MHYSPLRDIRLIALLDAISSTVPLHASAIRDRLGNDGRLDGVPSQRTIERDLEKLAREYPLTRVVIERRTCWRWRDEPLREQVMRMSAEHAFALVLVRRHLHAQLPADVATALRPYFDRAEAVLARSRYHPLANPQPAGNDEGPAAGRSAA